MALPLYLAMTREEIESSSPTTLSAYMACHFSVYGTGLQDLPAHLPQGSMLILNDRIPPWKQDPEQVAQELAQAAEQLECSAVLMDFQQPENPLIQAVVHRVCRVLSIPCAVTEAYAEEVSCGVFIAAPLPNQRLAAKATRWDGRELWLEAVTETLCYTITTDACLIHQSKEEDPVFLHRDEALCCSYRIELQQDQAIFTLGRTWEDLQKLMTQAETLGFTRAVGLYQQLGSFVALDIEEGES